MQQIHHCFCCYINFISYGFLCHPTEPGILEFFEGDFLRIGIPWDENRPSNHHANRGLDLMIFAMQQITVHVDEINSCPLGSCMVYLLTFTLKSSIHLVQIQGMESHVLFFVANRLSSGSQLQGQQLQSASAQRRGEGMDGWMWEKTNQNTLVETGFATSRVMENNLLRDFLQKMSILSGW